MTMSKLTELAEIEGFPTVDDMLEGAVLDSICPAICMNKGCNFTADYEPDQREGWCEECGTNSVKSALVLAQLI